jgi:hypothetical protein
MRQIEMNDIDSGNDLKVLEEENRSMFLSVAAFLMIGTMMLIAGAYYLNQVFGTLHIDNESYWMTRLILSLLIIALAFHSFSKHLITEGMTVLLIGLSALIFSITAIDTNTSGYWAVDVMFSFSISVSGILSLHKRNWLVGSGSLSAAVGIALPWAFKGLQHDLVCGVFLLIAGTLFTYYAFGCIIISETGRNILRITLNHGRTVAETADRPYEITAIAGLTVFGLCGTLAGVGYFESGDVAAAYCIGLAIVSLTAMAFASYALMSGIIPEGLMMLLFSLDSLMFSTITLMGFQYSPIISSVIGLVLLSSVLAFAFRKEAVLTLASLTMSAGYLINLLPLSDIGLSGMLVTAGSLVMIYYATSKWVLMVTGRHILPLR